MTSKNVGDVLFFFLGGGGGEQIGYSLKIICHKLVMVVKQEKIIIQQSTITNI